MANLSLSKPVGNGSKVETGDVSVDIPTLETSADVGKSRRRRVLHRVPPQLRENKNHIYEPVVLSLGPYHRNLRSQQFLQVEEFKKEILNNTIDPSIKGLFYSNILERIDEIRIFYGGLSIDEYKDEVLVEMMLRDACFILCYMEAISGDHEKGAHLVGRLGWSIVAFLFRDHNLLENQIPLWVLKLLITSKFDDKDAAETLICKYLSFLYFGNHQRMTRLPWAGREQEPLHLLEANRMTFVAKGDISSTAERRGRVFELFTEREKRSTERGTYFELGNSPFRSVTYLKAKGIYFGPSTYCLNDIKFHSHAFYGKLLLPISFVSKNTGVFFSNIVAFEMSPETDTDIDVLAYVNFMKSLLESPKDVKELRERGILFRSLRNDEEVLKVFKNIDTYGIDNEGIFGDVKMRINEHCDSKAKTWMAELIHTYFHSPWTAITFFAAGFLLCLTFLQTYYTVNPRKTN